MSRSPSSMMMVDDYDDDDDDYDEDKEAWAMLSEVHVRLLTSVGGMIRASLRTLGAGREEAINATRTLASAKKKRESLKFFLGFHSILTRKSRLRATLCLIYLMYSGENAGRYIRSKPIS